MTTLIKLTRRYYIIRPPIHPISVPAFSRRFFRLIKLLLIKHLPESIFSAPPYETASPCLPSVFAVEAGLFEDGDGDQHSPHRPVAHHWRHAEWLWGIQPEVWLRGRPRLFPRLDTPRLPAEGQGQRVHITTHTLRSDNLCLLSPPSKNLCSLLLPRRSGDEEEEERPSALSWKRWPGETTPRPCRARITWL